MAFNNNIEKLIKEEHNNLLTHRDQVANELDRTIAEIKKFEKGMELMGYGYAVKTPKPKSTPKVKPANKPKPGAKAKPKAKKFVAKIDNPRVQELFSLFASNPDVPMSNKDISEYLGIKGSPGFYVQALIDAGYITQVTKGARNKRYKYSKQAKPSPAHDTTPGADISEQIVKGAL